MSAGPFFIDLIDMTGWVFRSRTGRRIAAAMIAVALLPVLLFAILSARATSQADEAYLERRLTGVSQAYARSLRSRLGAADTVVQNLTARDVGYDGSFLRQQIVNSRAFKSTVVVDPDGGLIAGAPGLKPSAAQLVSLQAGQTLVLRAELEGQLPSVFLARAVTAGGFQRLAYFEIAPDWLWKDLGILATSIAVVDSDGLVVQSTIPLLPETGRMFAHEIRAAADNGRRAASQALAWQGAGEAWHGVLTHLSLLDERVINVPWAVVALDRETTFFSRSASVWALMPTVAIAGLVLAWLAAGWISRRHVPALQALDGGLRLLAEGRYDRLSVAAGDETRDVVRTFNATVARVEEQFQALETLGEIDQLLLGSPELEQMLESILERVQKVTRCHSVGITLRDADAPGRGRIYMAANGLTGLPVSRVELDGDMVETVASEKQGLTITRCEEYRHSFLRPLSEIGSEFFWVWPVMPGEKVEAILAVGYREAPGTDPLVAACGGQFAHRLAIALSKTARDERLHRQAHYDPLTSLPNRLLFLDRLAQEIAAVTAGLGRGALLYIDLDHFKRVNDTVGHAAGDQLLTIVAQRLRSCVKDGDTVARLGGDEFTVILRNVADPDAARSIADRIIESLQLPVNIGG
jgi:GGDEF domain-containing protein